MNNMTKKKTNKNINVEFSDDVKDCLDQMAFLENFISSEMFENVDKIDLDFAASEAIAQQNVARAKDIKGKIIFHMRDPNTKH